MLLELTTKSRQATTTSSSVSTIANPKTEGKAVLVGNFTGSRASSFCFTIFMIVKGFKKLCGEGGYLQRRNEMKLKRDAAKFEKLKSKFEPVVEKEAKGPVTDTNKGAANNTDRVPIVL